MRFQRLDIPAFGPFTGLALQFRREPVDLHVIYGPNEAGKSSLLRAIRDLLFGIPAQSPDDFLHEYKDLKIKAEISNSHAQTLVFQRRKGSKNTLQDGEGNVLPDQALSPFLASVDQGYFCAMFGLGANELREGARQLLRGEGELGQALFSASLGGTPVQRVLETLREQAERLYAGRATTKVTIRPGAACCKEFVRQSREAMVKPEDWLQLEQSLAEADSQKRAIEEQIAVANRELARIARCEGALPIVGRMAEAGKSLNELPPFPEVPADFPSRARQARTSVALHQTAVQQLRDRISHLQAQLAALIDSPVILSCAETLEHLHQSLGAYRSAKSSFETQKTRLAGLELILRNGMSRLEMTGALESLAQCHLSTPARLACEAAAEELRDARNDQAANARKIKELNEEIQEQQSTLDTLAEINLTQLRDALTAAEPAIEANASFATSQTEVNKLSRETAFKHRQIYGAPEDLDATARLPVPAVATIRLYKDQLDELARDLKSQQAKLAQDQARLQQLTAELSQISRQGRLPSEEDLRKARGQRDHGWQLVLADWKGHGATEELEPGLPLAEAFPKAVKRADDLADALRGEADAVAQAEQKRVQMAEAQSQIADTQTRLLELQSALDQRQNQWQAEWFPAGVRPRSPSEMLDWNDEWSAFRQGLEKLRSAQETLAFQTNRVQQAAARLAAALDAPEESSFSVLFAKAKSKVQKAEELRGQRAAVTKQLEKCRRQLVKLEQSRCESSSLLQAAAARWRGQCQSLGLPEDATPEIGLALLRERQELLTSFEQWQDLTAKQLAATQLVEGCEQLVAKTARTLRVSADSTPGLVAAMWSGLMQAREVQTNRAALTTQITKLQPELLQAQSRLAESTQVLEKLLAATELPSLDDLILAQLEQRDQLRAQIKQLRADLVGLAGSSSVDDFVEQVRAENPDELRARKANAETARSEHQSALTRAQEMLFKFAEEKRKLEQAGDAAAYYRQQAESRAAALSQDARRYLRLRLATHYLEHQIERFRRENQGPLLQKTGAIFSAITRGAYRGLVADVGPDDTPLLVALHPDNSRVFAEGLSDGTRDQLYLALRLAALDRHLQEHEPMPLILDDLLITFDNDRAAAILPPLADLARRTQVFLFTHHSHLVDICRETLGESNFHCHFLGCPP